MNDEIVFVMNFHRHSKPKYLTIDLACVEQNIMHRPCLNRLLLMDILI